MTCCERLCTQLRSCRLFKKRSSRLHERDTLIQAVRLCTGHFCRPVCAPPYKYLHLTISIISYHLSRALSSVGPLFCRQTKVASTGRRTPQLDLGFRVLGLRFRVKGFGFGV